MRRGFKLLPEEWRIFTMFNEPKPDTCFTHPVKCFTLFYSENAEIDVI